MDDDEWLLEKQEATEEVSKPRGGCRSRVLYALAFVLTVTLVSAMAATSTQLGKSAFQQTLSFLQPPTSDSEDPQDKLQTTSTDSVSTGPSGLSGPSGDELLDTDTATTTTDSTTTDTESTEESTSDTTSTTTTTTIAEETTSTDTDTTTSSLTPTMFPTDIAPTRYPTDSFDLEGTQDSEEEDATTTITTTTSKAVLPFSIYRDGYDILPYFSQSPSAFLKYKFLEGYHGVVEPNADMYPYVFAEEEAAEEGDETYYYTYTVCQEGDETQDGCTTEHLYTEPFNKACTPLEDTYSITVYQYETATKAKTGLEQTGAVMCVYVRREIRALSSADLTKTMDAMWKMWELEEDEGQALYGENFRNFAYLLEYHYFNAAWQDADHIHEGNGFLTQHVKMDGIFETSMQAVDPSISLPYWDFTVENATGLSVWDSPIFTADTFGTLGMPADTVKGWTYELDTVEDGSILDGRWANLFEA